MHIHTDCYNIRSRVRARRMIWFREEIRPSCPAINASALNFLSPLEPFSTGRIPTPWRSPLQHQVIARALELIADEANWSQGAWARTASGKPCPWIHPGAQSFCAFGALNRAAFELAAGGGTS